MSPVSRWFSALLPRLLPLLRANGGPVLMLQMENEYGGFGCDLAYLAELRDLVRRHLGPRVVLYQTDNPQVVR